APINVPVITAPISVPTSISAPDLNAIPTVTDVVARASDIAGTSSAAKSGAGSASGTGRAVSQSTGDVVSASRGDGSAWGEEQVDVAVRQQGAANLKYPDRLRAANVSGTVMMRFIVGANGRVEMSSVKVLDSPHDEFTAAVKDALRSMRFRAAEVRGTKVRQLVEQSFTFRLG
nr:energy transducer TonB [Gemmatimonadaceae bacterium]